MTTQRKARVKQTVWIIWDGASYPLIVDLLQRGALPYLQRVISHGTLGAMMPPGPNCETPPGLMTLFTGLEEAEHGVPGFVGLRQPFSRHSILETLSGFDVNWLRQPPVWVEAAARCRTITLAATAFAPDPLHGAPYPWPYPTASYRCVLDGYRHEIAAAQLVPLPDTATTVKIANYQLDITRQETLRHIRPPGGPWHVLPSLHQPEELVPIWLETTSGVGVYVARLTEPGRASSRAREWLWCSAATRLVTQPGHAWPAALGPFLGAGIGWHFSRGVLGKGPRLSTAVLEAITRRVAKFFGDMAVWALTLYPANLVMLYQPALDEIAHQVLRDALADWPHGAAAQAFISVHQEVDRQLGRVLDHLGHEDTLIISSDHGQMPISASLRPNVLLRQAGLLALKGDKVDLEHTRALYLSNGWVVVNATQRRGGIVPPQAYARTLQEVEHCLATPLSLPAGQALRLRCQRDLWQGTAPPPGDIFVWPPAGIELRPHFFGPVCGPPEVGGHHQTPLHGSPYLQAFLAGCGPGMTAVSLPTRNSGVADLVRHSLAL
jgi:Type I phosphodiesterase / nucleotide pyrophosphatase